LRSKWMGEGMFDALQKNVGTIAPNP
jgi:hypothetical protein